LEYCEAVLSNVALSLLNINIIPIPIFTLVGG